MQQVGEAKLDRLFCATAILAILEEPPRLDAGTTPAAAWRAESAIEVNRIRFPGWRRFADHSYKDARNQ